MNTDIALYRKAKKILDANQVTLTNFKDDTFYFTVKEYDVTLSLTKNDNLWIRNWSCSCASYALKQDKIRCAHVIAAETYLVLTDGKEKNRRNNGNGTGT